MWQIEARRLSNESDSELKLIPLWSVTLAFLCFALCQYFFFHIMPPPSHPGYLPMRALTSYSSGAALASYVLLIGYISRDVRRRGMSAGVWMLVVLVMPGGIGAVVYFLMRQPVLLRCPSCSTEISSSFHFCPQCQFQFAPVCGRCFRGTQVTDIYCVNCGHDLAEDATPSRLRVYSD